MIAQAVAIEHPERVRSLTSIMSTTGDRRVGAPTEAAIGALLAPPARRARRRSSGGAGYRMIGSPGFELDEAEMRDRAGRGVRPGARPGRRRRASSPPSSPPPDRTPALRKLRVPALVLHGRDDPLVGLSGGEATAAAIPGAELVVIDGMGHDLPRAAWPEIVAAIAALVARAEGERRAA